MTSTSAWSVWVVVLVPTLLAVAVFANTIGHSFTYDDRAAVAYNHDLHGSTPWTTLFSHDFWGARLDQEYVHAAKLGCWSKGCVTDVMGMSAQWQPQELPPHHRGHFPVQLLAERPRSHRVGRGGLDTLLVAGSNVACWCRANRFHATNILLHAAVTGVFAWLVHTTVGGKLRSLVRCRLGAAARECTVC